MTGHATHTGRLAEAGAQIYSRIGSFLGVFVVLFFASVFTLERFDLLPNGPKAGAAPKVALIASAVKVNSPAPTVGAEIPVKIEIAKISLSATIANPTSSSSEVLDQGLLHGAVRYPTSAKLGEVGNVVLFGHSSYLPIVGNQAYKTFDGIQKLVAGDMITVYSAGSVYTYRVRSMTKESAASDAGIELSVAGKVLTLVTCNSFATKSDRFIVTADFVESHSISI